MGIINKNNIVEVAEKFVNKELNASELHHLKVTLANDSSLADEWRKSLHFITTLRAATEHQQVRNMIGDTIAQAKKDTAITKSSKTITFLQNPKTISFIKYLKIGSIAALIAIVSSLITFWGATNTSKKNSTNQYTKLRREMGREIEDIKRAQPATIQSSNTPSAPSDYSGTGFAITNDGYIATDYHVIEDADSIFIQTANGNYNKAFVVAFDPNSDIAILKINDNKFKFGKSNILPYSFTKSRADLAQQVFSIGYPSDDPIYNQGYISAEKGYEGDIQSYQLDITANPGQSGSPVFDKNGNVIAIVTAKENTATYAIHCEALAKLIQSLPAAAKVNIPNSNSLASLDRTTQVQKLMNYICAVKVYK